MEKPDFVSNENFEKLMNEYSNPEKNFENDKRIVISYAHRIIEILCNDYLVKFENIFKTKDGFIIEIKKFKYGNNQCRLYINNSNDLANDIIFYIDSVNEIFDKYFIYKHSHYTHYIQKPGSEVLHDQITNAFFDEFRKHLGYNINIINNERNVEITAIKVE